MCSHVALAVVVAICFASLGCGRLNQSQTVTAFGTIEADEVFIGSEVGARILAVPVKEGDAVAVGDLLVRLDDSIVQLELRQSTDPAIRIHLELQAEKYKIRSPLAGLVTRLPAHAGEVASPGQTLVAVADLAHLKLTAYVLERDLGRVSVGQRVTVVAEPLPSLEFPGVVSSINPRAEFTPRNVQTARDRQNLVFGVKVRLENPGGALKPGMPAQVTFRSATG